ncbi:imidazole glycerol phosphate synthase subunit HisH [Amedibacillus dolichus]|uniref:Imidazole glycerol phosphate synthase subunit HisH n=1 Tax=Amedibacillus dolichus TaxID=31971 RepID=A0A415PRD1_9FIRM|nr:imidazole glycerol phosphate synthase subunit HisH [Amedibacillus dolichus]RHM15246.1 imidazole glycerol phosphate synthase subunit HisH [Amedibacillus dolichus]
MIAIIDYGMGNLRSVENALRYLKTDYCITNDAEVLRKADGWILPGVGAFADCMKKLQALGLVELLKEEVGNGTKPLLGICLGMQVLFEESEEGGLSKGLGLLKGKVVKMIDPQARIPHIGWNLLEYDQPHPLFTKLSEKPFVYFVHSYYAVHYDSNILIAHSCYHDLHICALVAKGHIVGAQFHPEKSGTDGLAILRYFVEECV